MASPRSYAGTVRAPDFPPLEWLNTERPLSLSDLKGKVVLLDFWTYGCINCMHIIPDLKRLEEKYDEELVVIGVHSAKFRNEGNTQSLRQIVLRYELEHPVVNDRDFLVWRAYGARAWPTLVLLDPDGRIVGRHAGENIFEPFDHVIGGLIAEFDAQGGIDRRPLALRLEGEGLPETALSFPGKVLADAAGRRLFVADSNHHRIIIIDLDTYRVERVIGGPQSGFADGEYGEARFHHPQGMVLGRSGSRLFVADTGNHAIRSVDLAAERVTILAGTGEQSHDYPGRGGRIPHVELNSPWDVETAEDHLYIAMAGSHQIWRLDVDQGTLGPWVGSGAEGIDDGPAAQATLAQPSGLTTDGTWLYFADAEASAIRAASLDTGRVRTIVGTGLFDFGDEDGVGGTARLQHALGLVFRPADGLLYVADTYNSKLKTVHPNTGEVRTLLGGDHGWRDTPDPLFHEPGGLDIAGDLLYVADTNNHAIRLVDLTTRETRTLVLRDIQALLDLQRAQSEEVVELAPQALRAGEGTLQLDVAFPPGLRPDELTPLTIDWLANPLISFPGGRRRRRLVGGRFPVETPVRFRPGDAVVEADINVPYCPGEAAADDGDGVQRVLDGSSLCAARIIRVRLPLHISAEGDETVRIAYRLPRVH